MLQLHPTKNMKQIQNMLIDCMKTSQVVDFVYIFLKKPN